MLTEGIASGNAFYIFDIINIVRGIITPQIAVQ